MTKIATADSVSAELRIKIAAHKVFLAKGFAATTVRDVAKEARTNVASVNYYFRTKKNLFNVIMTEKAQQILGALGPVLGNERTTLDQKIDSIVNCYLDFLLANPDLPMLILNEVKKKNFEFISGAQINKLLLQSNFLKQLKAVNGTLDPVQFFITMVGMILFPFVAKPVILQTGLVKEKDFQSMIQERRALVPVWVKVMLKTRQKR